MQTLRQRHMKRTGIVALLALALVITGLQPAQADVVPSKSLDGYGMKIFRVESGLYPFVQIYFRTFDQQMEPLANLNERNVGIMVSGRSYDPFKRQYFVQSIRNRQEMIRSILVMDTSATMAGRPFELALEAAGRFIDAKRPQDQVAVVALTDNKEGYELVSNFEQDPGTLGRRLADLRANGKQTRLYDGVAYALQMAAGAGPGGSSTGDAAYPASTSIVIFSDGKDEGSSITRDDLMTRITTLNIPIPIYSLAYTKLNPQFLKNLQALSMNTFGQYYHIAEAYEKMSRTVEGIQHILQNDYVVTFRSYLPIDGKKHIVKIGVEYPSNSGNMRYESSEFETIEPPAFQRILEAQHALNEALPLLPDSNPYLTNPFTSGLNNQPPAPAQPTQPVQPAQTKQ